MFKIHVRRTNMKWNRHSTPALDLEMMGGLHCAHAMPTTQGHMTVQTFKAVVGLELAPQLINGSNPINL